jgi:MFS family permease
MVLDRLSFPLNYQVVFLALSLGGLFSYYYSSHIELPDAEPRTPRVAAVPLGERLRGAMGFLRQQGAFLTFVSKRFVYALGAFLTVPLLPLFFVRVLNASDTWIGFISTAQTATMLVGYAIWARLSRSRGSRFALLCTVFCMGLYPALVAVTRDVQWMVILAGLAGIFQAGIDLIFFDELMRTIPPEHSATLVGVAASLQYLATFVGPFLGTTLADHIGIPAALAAGAALRLVGFVLFARNSGSDTSPRQS